MLNENWPVLGLMAIKATRESRLLHFRDGGEHNKVDKDEKEFRRKRPWGRRQGCPGVADMV